MPSQCQVCIDEVKKIAYNQGMENLEALKAACEALLTTTQAATRKGVSRQAVADAVKAGTLQAIRSKAPRLFRIEDVEAWTPYGALIKRRAKDRKTRPPPAP